MAHSIPAFRLPAARVLALAALLPAAVGLLPSRARAATFNWQGGGANNNWSTAANWVGGVAPVNNGSASLVFGNTAAVFPSIQPAYSILSLTFSAGASAYNFDTGPLTIQGGGLNQSAANGQGFSARVNLGVSQTWFLANGSGSLTFSGGLNLNGANLGVAANTTTGLGNVINGVVSGSGVLTKINSGTLTLTGANLFSGGVSLNAGTLGAGNDAALGTGGLTVAGVGGSLFAAGADRTLGNAVAINTGNTLNVVADPTGAHNLTLNGVLSGAGGLTVNAAGTTVTLGGSNAANTFTGLTSVTAGTLLLNKNNGGTAVAGNLTIGNSVNPGAPGSVVVRLNSFNQLGNGSAGAVTIGPDGLLDLNGNSAYVGALNLTAGAITIGPSGPLLRLTGDVTTNASGASSVITGGGATAVILNGVRTFTVARGTGTYDLDVQSGTAFGTLVKAGEGVLRLAGAPDQTLAVTLNAGTLAVANDGALGPDGAFTLAGGTVVADGAGRAVSNPVNVTANATVGVSVDGTPRALTFTGATSLAAGATLTVANNAGTTFSNVISGAGGIVKTGAGTLTLGNTANTFTGGLTLNGGTLAIAGEGSLGGAANVVTLNAGLLQFTGNTTTARAFNLNNAVSLGVATGSTLTFASGASVNGGNLAAGGTLAFTDGSALNGATTALGSVVTTSGVVAATNVTLRGATTVNAGSTVTATNTVLSSAGTLAVNGTVRTAGFESSGVTTIFNGGALANGTTAAVFGGGSRTTVLAGGTLSTASGTTIEVNGAQLVNNGTQTGTVNVNYGSTVKGAGSFGNVNVTDGGRFSPGNSPGTASLANASFGAGSRYDFELNSANATPDNGVDFLSVSGALTLSAGTTANSRFVVGLFTLDQSNNPAMLADFDSSRPYTFTLATAGQLITTFDPAAATVDPTGFLNATNGGTFAVALSPDGRSLLVQFNPVPEPGAWALLLVGAGALGALGWRRRRAVR